MKYFIRGLGVGIVITALLLCIAYRKQMNDTSIIQKARALGMDFISDNSQTQAVSSDEIEEENELPPDDAKSASNSSPPSDSSPPSNSSSSSDSPPTSPDSSAKPNPTKAPVSSAKPANPNKKANHKEITIQSGLLSSTVANQFEEAGIISDAKEFDNYLVRNGYGERIRVGVYKIPNGASYAEIAQMIAG
ncbi:MAG: endolytic transglycosylase MltG [Lachnoclostridium sp.]|nr:endolytic transglycosylase MltG [Lachnoclostridium sp.]